MFTSVKQLSSLLLMTAMVASCGGDIEVPNPAFSGGDSQVGTDPVLGGGASEVDNNPVLGGGIPEVGTNLILQQLILSTVESITINDGLQAMTGDWAKFTPDTTWNWQLNGVTGAAISTAINLEYEADVYVVDLFAQLESDSITPLHDMGRKVVCYFSAGTYEPWRADKDLFSGLSFGNPHQAYPNELWLDINDPLVAKLMANRMDMAVALGCDGVELDNVDGWIPSANSGFSFNFDDQLLFNKVLANEAHERGLAVALKNNVEMIVDLADYFDLVINEECFEYNECEGYRPMIEKGKAVFNAEYKLFDSNNETLQPVADYPAERSSLCAKSIEFGFQTLLLPIELDGTFRFSCR